ncbi:HYDIN protein, partial [Zosterops hypoxanthus]|nr:HYDIN protein [Zosterops hypoxanthus]
GERKASGKAETKATKKEETKAPEKGERKASGKAETKAPKKGASKGPEKGKQKVPKKGVPTAPKKGETKGPKKGEQKAPKKGETKAPEQGEPKAPEDEETAIAQAQAEMEKNLMLRFQIHEFSQQNVKQVYSYWDRVKGTVELPVIEQGNKTQPSPENKGQKTSKPQEKVEKKPAQKRGGQSRPQSSQLETQSKVAESVVRDKHVGVPCLDIQFTDPKTMFMEIMRSRMLPTKDQMLRHLGLHPEGPPLPPVVVLSLVNYPEERLGSAEHAKAQDVKGSSAEGQPKTGEAVSRDNSPKENRISTQRTERSQDSSTTRPKSTLKSASIPTEFLRLKRYRWIVPAHDEVELKVHFFTENPGKFEQTLKFEVAGTKRQYELPCSAIGLYPSICQDPRLVFPKWRETMEADEIICKEYVQSTKQFHFGPLLCGKSRKWYVLLAGPCTF